MGRMLLFLVIGMSALFAVANLNMTYSDARLINNSIEQYERLQAKNIASSGVQYAVSQIGQDTTWTGIQSLTMGDGSLKVLVAATTSQYPDGPAMGLTGMRQITSIGTVNGVTDTIMAVVQTASASSVPPFLSYACASQSDLLIQGSFSVTDDGNPLWNANIHTNADLYIDGGGYTVEGFGTYVGSMLRDHGHGQITNNFDPNVNPDGLATAYQSSPVTINLD